MKRASYCADERAYTVAGTQIAIADDQHIQSATPTLDTVEAVWSPTGAVCINLENMRHSATGFSGTCPNVNLHRCTEQNTTGRYLLDAPLHPGP
jgi:hypothetical protein